MSNGKVYAAIRGAGHYAPERVLTNDDLSRMVETNDEWIRTRTGISQRRIARPDEYTSDMATAAARMALADAGIAPDEVDLIVVATCTPDMIFPATACFVQNALGCTHAYGFDLSSACSGFLMALETATGAIEAGRVRTALVIGAEKLSSITDWTKRETCVLFGDGAGAVVVQASERPGILSSQMGVDGALADMLSLPASGCRHPASEQTLADRLHYVHMSGGKTFKSAVRVMADTAVQVVRDAGLTFDDIDLMVPHQANLRIIEAVAARLEGDLLPKCFVNLDRFGNTSGASIPLALSEAQTLGRIKPHDKVLMVAFGGGLSWGGIVVEWKA